MKKYLLLFVLTSMTNHAVAAPLWRCVFDEGVSANWDSGALDINEGKFSKSGTTRFEFEILDEGLYMAEFRANLGSSPVEYFETGNGVTFVEKISTGNVIITTIFSDLSTENLLKAVHSRHSVSGSPMPSQYYGVCAKHDNH